MIIVREEGFDQTPGLIHISFEFPSPVSVYSSPLYVSLNASPFFYEIDLVERIDTAKSKVLVENGRVTLELVKQVEGIWEKVRYSGGDVRQRREISRKEEEKRLKELKEVEIRLKRENERDLVRKQMAVEGEMRERVMKLKENETALAKNEIMEFARDSKNMETPNANARNIGGMVTSDPSEKELQQLETTAAVKRPTLQDILDSSEDSDSDLDLESIRTKVKSSLAKPKHCPPRQTTTTRVKLKFSDRGLIPTSTARESEDAKWMTRIKLVKAMESHQKSSQDKAVVEELKQKGNGFFKLGDYKSALNAYTQAIEGDGNDASLFANRAAALLKLGNSEAEGDCTAGLDIITRERSILKELAKDDGREEIRSKLEVKLLMRRGACRAELMDNIRDGLSDYEKALELDPNNESLVTDVEMLRNKLATS